MNRVWQQPLPKIYTELSDAELRLRALVAAEPHTWCEIENVVAFGRAHREILQVAETKAADLIVMGAQGRGGVGLALFESTTQQVLRGAASPVLTVRGTACYNPNTAERRCSGPTFRSSSSS